MICPFISNRSPLTQLVRVMICLFNWGGNKWSKEIRNNDTYSYILLIFYFNWKYTYEWMHIKVFIMENFKHKQKYKSRENNIMNSHGPVTQFKQLSLHGQSFISPPSCFSFLPSLFWSKSQKPIISFVNILACISKWMRSLFSKKITTIPLSYLKQYIYIYFKGI